jgi:hypothetical protein
MKKEPTTLFSAQLTSAELHMFNTLAVDEGLTKVGMLRIWLNRYNNRMMRRAKSDYLISSREEALKGVK